MVSQPVAATRQPAGLRARGLSHRFGSVVALDDVSLEVPAGTCMALVGESGSGKTTLLRSFNRMLRPDHGDVFVGEANVLDQDAILLRRRVGYVQQRGGLIPHWTAAENAGLVVRAGGGSISHEVAEAFDAVGLSLADLGHRFPRELSGGQAQRVAIARALVARPEAILLDEPFGALDAITRGEVQDAFDRARRDLGMTALLVTHDLAEAGRLAQSIAVMRGGRIEQAGTMADLRDRPATPYVASLVTSALAASRALSA